LSDTPEKTTQILQDEILGYAKGLSFKGQAFSDDPAWSDRIAEIIDHLPDDRLEPILARLRTSVGEDLIDIGGFSKAYGLTPAEQKLLDSLFMGRSVPDHAAYYSISVNTGRVHMQRVLDKTGASGQLDLIRLLYAHK